MPKNRKNRKVQRILEESIAMSKVIYWFFSFPTKEISLNDLCEEVEISKTTANRIINALEEDGFLKKEVLGKTWRISNNQDHAYNTILKIPYNLELIYESEITNRIYEKFQSPRNIILFGSYRKGDDTEESDIDIAIEVLNNKEVEIYDLGKIDIGYRKNIPIKLHVFSRKKIDLNLFSNIANGIILEGLLEVKP